MRKQKHKILIFFLISIIFVISSFFLLREIYDPDFFWHIKTGEWIWQHKALPPGEPFAYTSSGHRSSREHFILTAFWLSEVLYHLTYLAGGTNGIAIMRFLIVGALSFVVWKRRQGDTIVYLGFMIFFLTCLLSFYPIERPQVFSFLFFTVLLYLLGKITKAPMNQALSPLGGGADGKGGGGAIYFLIPLLMLLWANTHPGFIVGQATLILYVIMEGAKFLHPAFHPAGKKFYKRLCLAAVLGILFSFANPNTYLVWKEYWEYKIPVDHWNLTAAYLASVNPDYMSSIQYFIFFNDYSVILCWLIMLAAISGYLLNPRKSDITDLALMAATGLASFMTIRYSFFFMVAVLPAAAESFSRGRLLKFCRLFIPVSAVLAGIFFAWGERSSIEGLRSGVKVDDHFQPVRAADFIISSGIRGNMYNAYEWGGYLMWRLAPERKVFIDPRDIFGDVTLESGLMDIANARESPGKPAWKTIAREHHMEYMVLPIARPTGRVVPLFIALMQDEDWLPVFCDINAAVFVKNSPANEDVIGKYSIPKDYLMKGLLELYERLTRIDAHKPSPYITKGDLYLSQARVEKAVDAYEKALEAAPLNITARERLELLGRGRSHDFK